MKQIFTRVFLLLLVPLFFLKNSFSQCGTAPTSGTISVGAANQVLNSYYPAVTSAAAGTSTITLGTRTGNTTALAAGDLVLIIQMQGADFNTSNNDSYGDGVSGGNASGYSTTGLIAGKFEYNIVNSYSGNTLVLQYPLTNSYKARASSTSQGIQSYQVIQVPRFFRLDINAGESVTAYPWDGSSGGVVVLEVADRLRINGSINVNGLGFRGGGGKSRSGIAATGSTNGTGVLTNTDYRWVSPALIAQNRTGGSKGEGICGTPRYTFRTGQTDSATGGAEGYVAGSIGRGAPGNAGGGGTDGDVIQNQYNTGGGGGGNGGAGGRGGGGWDGGSGGNADPNTYNTGGFGGAAFTQINTSIAVMGGGGGAGTCNNASLGGTDILSSGGCGGGIVILRAKTYSGTGSVTANGRASTDITTAGVTDAAGGGGAGGTIIALVNQAAASAANTISATATGGKGGNSTVHWAHGPGGGGGGGLIITNALGGTKTVTGGANGLTRSRSEGSTSGTINDAYNSTPGSNGIAQTITSFPLLLNPGNASSPCGILPVTLTAWNGVYRNDKTYLSWQADKGVDFSHFVVERSSDGVNYISLGQVQASTSAALTLQYSFIDIAPAGGANYYRLKMVDIDGRYQYSGIITIRTNIQGFNVTASPNPFTDNVVITIESKTDETVHLRVFNNDGKLVWRKSISVNAGTNARYFSELQSLPKGIYFIKVNKQNSEASLKLIKQ
jgi:hypothetical protein